MGMRRQRGPRRVSEIREEVLPSLDAKKDAVLSVGLIKRICHQLEQKCRDVDLW